MSVVYNNLGQYAEGRLVYFRSTDVEQMLYHRLLWSVPDEWFYLLARGEEIIVKDISTHRDGKIKRIFIPVLVDLLRWFYLELPPLFPGKKEHLAAAKFALVEDKLLWQRMRFWKGLIWNISITAETVCQPKEPNTILKLWEERRKLCDLDLDNLKSACCQAPVYVAPLIEPNAITHWYACGECGKPCEVEEIERRTVER